MRKTYRKIPIPTDAVSNTPEDKVEVDPELLDRTDKICYNEDKDKKNRAFGIRNKTKGTKISSR